MEPTAMCQKKTDWLLITRARSSGSSPTRLPCVNHVAACLSAEQFDPSGPVRLFCIVGAVVTLLEGHYFSNTMERLLHNTQYRLQKSSESFHCANGPPGAAGKHQRHLSLLRCPLLFQGITHKHACMTCSYAAAPHSHPTS